MGESNTEVKGYSTGINNYVNAYLPMVQKQMTSDGEDFDEYSRYCVVSAIGEIIDMVHKSGVQPSEINANNLNDILLLVARLKLNANAYPRECYFQIRSVNVGGKGNPKWEKQIEFNIEGDGYDSLAARYGRDIKKIYPYWLVRENDDFKYPSMKGLSVSAPEWTPKGTGKYIRVVYPIEYTDGHIEYHIAERDDVAHNLAAHINNNLMNETFGILTGNNSKGSPKTRYDATSEEKKKIDAKKKEIMSKVKSMGSVDSILSCEELLPYISPSWSEFQSQESMIVRKMRNNIVKKIPKDFDSSAAHAYNMIEDAVYREIQNDVTAEAIQEEFVPQAIEEKPISPSPIEQTKAQPQKEPVPTEPHQNPLPSFMQQETM